MEQQKDRLIREISDLILAARNTAAYSINLLQVLTNYEIGRRIVTHEQQGSERAEYGKALIKELSSFLTDEFGNGFSMSNLEYMRRFYLTYQDRNIQITQTPSGQFSGNRKSQTPSGILLSNHDLQDLIISNPTELPAHFTLSWSHYVFLMGIKNADERNFYEIEATSCSWSLRELKRQFNTGLYERLALSRDKDAVRNLALKGQLVTKPQDLLKEPYVLEFLGLDEKNHYSESDLETAIINKLEHFLLEMGKGFLFEARQRRFTFDEDHFFVDLVFYNRLLRCYVLVDLKLGKLAHHDLGQMQTYVNYFDRYVKLEDENPTVGIILCKKKHNALVEITLPKEANIHAREYQLYLPDKKELEYKLIEWITEHE